VLFTGDLATPGHHPLVAEADLPTWLEVLKRMQDKDLAKHLVPGRGSPCNRAALEQTAGYLNDMRARVQALIRSRKARTETALLVAEFMARYDVADQDRDCIQRRIKAGLDHLYDALKAKK
jgi:glyoxylase-like metal-dependent hydrolase (beta-lactamase superfamily II)